MKLERIVDWLDRVLDVKSFSDVSNNGVQIAREGDDVTKVAFGVDASVRTVKAAAAAGAQLLVVHHGISWGGGIQRLVGATYNVVKAAMDANVALYAVHLPLDANHAYGNNYELARYLGLKNLKPAFVYHGETIGVVGTLPNGKKVGVCSGGAGCHATDAKELGCDLFITGEADWGEGAGMRSLHHWRGGLGRDDRGGERRHADGLRRPLPDGDVRGEGAREGDGAPAQGRHRVPSASGILPVVGFRAPEGKK